MKSSELIQWLLGTDSEKEESHGHERNRSGVDSRSGWPRSVGRFATRVIGVLYQNAPYEGSFLAKEYF